MTLDKRSRQIRHSVIDMVKSGRRGHIPSAFSIVEVLRVLYDDVLKYDSRKPDWEKRDRFILSKGHGCMSLYAILADKGFFPVEILSGFCSPESILGGHPEYGIPGVEFSTGSLGHGLSAGVGMALAARIKKNPYRVFVLLGDGECNEGAVWEAAMTAAKHKLDNLIVIVDYNKMQSYGKVSEVQNLDPFVNKWEAFGFSVKESDGHDIRDIKKVLKKLPFVKNKPSLIISHSIKGKGVDFMEQTAGWHHRRGLTDADMEKLHRAIDEYK